MKLRTKLILLLTAALGVTITVSTLIRIRWMRARLESQLRDSAQDTAAAIAADLGKQITPDKDDDDIQELLKSVKLRHPIVADLELKLPTDEETTSTFTLPSATDEPQVAKQPRAQNKQRGERARREDARRALTDHGDAMRAPDARLSEPLWRTGDRPEVSRWAPRAETIARTPANTVFREGVRGAQTLIEVTVPLDPDGPRRGELRISVTEEPIERFVRNDQLWSVIIASLAVLVLALLATVIVDRVVARPVGALQEAMKRVEGGALDERVAVERVDEVGQLARGFNAMLGRLELADGEIRAFNRRLADEVHAATLDLARKNETLAQLNRILFETRQELGDKERLAALGQLAAQLAHEIGTPLGSVSGHLQLALTARDLPTPLGDRLKVAKQELERISKIVRDYLDSTRTVAPERVPVELARVVDEAVGIALGGEARAHISVERNLDADVEWIDTDPGMLRQILINLLSNAADALGPDGRRISVESTRSGAQVAISIADDGVGISAEDMARVFEPFYTTKGRGKGTGLGLAICRELASALGGRVSVQSSPGRGSTFTLLLPAGDGMRQKNAS